MNGSSWRRAFAVYRRPRVLAMALLGFAAGLPFLLVFSTLTARLVDAAVDRTTIGFFAWVGLTYSVKVVWAPVVDGLGLPGLDRWLGRRRGWIALGQVGVLLGLLGIAVTDPGAHLWLVAVCALLVAFASATQDIAIDAWRIEAEPEGNQGAMSASYVFGYRVALLVAGAGALLIAEFYDWQIAYIAMAACMGLGLVTVLAVGEPDSGRSRQVIDQPVAREFLSRHGANAGRWRRFQAWCLGSMVGPFVEFFERNGRFAMVVLLFIAVFRLSDIAMGIMANPFYLDLGFTKGEIASVVKLFGFFMTIAGSGACGLLVLRYGILPCLMIGAAAVAFTNLLFIVLAQTGPQLQWLALVISMDNLSGGFAATAFVAYLSKLTDRSYTATQYALFSSLMTLPGKFLSGFSGWIVELLGYEWFFFIAACFGLPAVLLVLVLRRQPGAVSPAAEPAP